MLLPPLVPIPDTLNGIDDLIRLNFDGFREIWFNRLLAATFLVVVGLVMEGPELWYEIHAIVHRWFFNRRFHFSITEDHTPDWAKLLAFLGWILIVIGVAGEFVADSFVSKADGFVQKFDEVLLTDAQQKSSLASKRSAMAFERAARIEKEAAEDLKATTIARQKAEESREKAESARIKAEGLELQIAQANERAAKEEREAAEIKESIAPRRLTNEQQAEIRHALRAFEGQQGQLVHTIGDTEGLVFAADIWRALRAARWNVFAPGGMMQSSSMGMKELSTPSTIGGIYVTPAINENSERAAKALVAELSKLGFTATVENPSTNLNGDFLQISVDSRPLGPQGEAKLRAGAKQR